MILSALIKRNGLSRIVTATPATTATEGIDNPATVASVASVAVAETQKQPPELSPDEEFCIRAWLAHIDETDPASIDEVLEKCTNNLDARRYFLKRSIGVPLPHSGYRPRIKIT